MYWSSVGNVVCVQTQESEAGHPLHALPIYAVGLQVGLPEVNIQFFGLRSVVDQVVVRTLDLIPVCCLITATAEVLELVSGNSV